MALVRRVDRHCPRSRAPRDVGRRLGDVLRSDPSVEIRGGVVSACVRDPPSKRLEATRGCISARCVRAPQRLGVAGHESASQRRRRRGVCVGRQRSALRCASRHARLEARRRGLGRCPSELGRDADLRGARPRRPRPRRRRRHDAPVLVHRTNPLAAILPVRPSERAPSGDNDRTARIDSSINGRGSTPRLRDVADLTTHRRQGHDATAHLDEPRGERRQADSPSPHTQGGLFRDRRVPTLSRRTSSRTGARERPAARSRQRRETELCSSRLGQIPEWSLVGATRVTALPFVPSPRSWRDRSAGDGRHEVVAVGVVERPTERSQAWAVSGK